MSKLKSPTNYKGVRSPNPPKIITAKRAPLATDTDYVIGDLWWFKPENVFYMYSGVQSGSAIWQQITFVEGSDVLVAGQATIASTAVTANSVIMVVRTAVNGSTAIGQLVAEQSDITPGVSFVVKSLDATAAVETDDVSSFFYVIM